MADDNKQEKDKIIDVTKPKTESIPRSNIDASRVSSYTMREQQSLEKLKKTVGGPSNNGGRSSKIKTIVAIILVLILIILLIVFAIVLFFCNRGKQYNCLRCRRTAENRRGNPKNLG